MAYATSRLNLVVQPFGGPAAGFRLWHYLNSDNDADATIVGSGYFSDGVSKGMAVGDLVDVVETGTAKYKRYQVASVNTTTKAATVAAPTAIT